MIPSSPPLSATELFQDYSPSSPSKESSIEVSFDICCSIFRFAVSIFCCFLSCSYLGFESSFKRSFRLSEEIFIRLLLNWPDKILHAVEED